jgi:hypothetical protein
MGNIVVHTNLPQLLRIGISKLPHNIIHVRCIVVLPGYNFREHFVFPRFKVNFSGYAAVAPPGATSAYDVFSRCRTLFLEQEMKVETIFAFKPLEEPIIKL